MPRQISFNPIKDFQRNFIQGLRWYFPGLIPEGSFGWLGHDGWDHWVSFIKVLVNLCVSVSDKPNGNKNFCQICESFGKADSLHTGIRIFDECYECMAYLISVWWLKKLHKSKFHRPCWCLWINLERLQLGLGLQSVRMSDLSSSTSLWNPMGLGVALILYICDNPSIHYL